MTAQALEQSVLESKDKTQLIQIAEAPESSLVPLLSFVASSSSELSMDRFNAIFSRFHCLLFMHGFDFLLIVIQDDMF